MSHPARSTALALLLGLVSLALAACTQVEEFESTYTPTTVEPIEGSEDIQKVTFSEGAARRAGIETAKVRPSGRRTTIPYAALIYDEEGATFTYVSPKPLVYVREPIDVDHVADDRVVLRHGPPTGTTVVTTGAAEVYSAEFGVEE
jgi:hypothetical protein